MRWRDYCHRFVCWTLWPIRLSHCSVSDTLLPVHWAVAIRISPETTQNIMHTIRSAAVLSVDVLHCGLSQSIGRRPVTWQSIVRLHDLNKIWQQMAAYLPTVEKSRYMHAPVTTQTGQNVNACNSGQHNQTELIVLVTGLINEKQTHQIWQCKWPDHTAQRHRTDRMQRHILH